MNILFVCTGNTCRSPLAESYATSIYPNHHFSSSGLFVSSHEISEQSKHILKNASLTLGSPPKVLSHEEVENYKLLVMTDQHKQYIEMLYENADVELISEFAGSGKKDVSDPFGGNLNAYEETFSQIKAYIDQFNLK